MGNIAFVSSSQNRTKAELQRVEDRKTMSRLIGSTNLTMNELEELHVVFNSEYPRGLLTRSAFILDNAHIHGGPWEFWERVYDSADIQQALMELSWRLDLARERQQERQEEEHRQQFQCLPSTQEGVVEGQRDSTATARTVGGGGTVGPRGRKLSIFGNNNRVTNLLSQAGNIFLRGGTQMGSNVFRLDDTVASPNRKGGLHDDPDGEQMAKTFQKREDALADVMAGEGVGGGADRKGVMSWGGRTVNPQHNQPSRLGGDSLGVAPPSTSPFASLAGSTLSTPRHGGEPLQSTQHATVRSSLSPRQHQLSPRSQSPGGGGGGGTLLVLPGGGGRGLSRRPSAIDLALTRNQARQLEEKEGLYEPVTFNPSRSRVARSGAGGGASGGSSPSAQTGGTHFIAFGESFVNGTPGSPSLFAGPIGPRRASFQMGGATGAGSSPVLVAGGRRGSTSHLFSEGLTSSLHPHGGYAERQHQQQNSGRPQIRARNPILDITTSSPAHAPLGHSISHTAVRSSKRFDLGDDTAFFGSTMVSEEGGTSTATATPVTQGLDPIHSNSFQQHITLKNNQLSFGPPRPSATSPPPPATSYQNEPSAITAVSQGAISRPKSRAHEEDRGGGVLPPYSRVGVPFTFSTTPCLNYEQYILLMHQDMSSELRIKRVFLICDVDGDGFLNKDDLTTSLSWIFNITESRHLRANPRVITRFTEGDDEWAKVKRSVDGETGRVRSAHLTKLAPTIGDPELRAMAILASMDVDEDGVLNEEEFREGCKMDYSMLELLTGGGLL